MPVVAGTRRDADGQERGTALEYGLFSIEGELIDVSVPSVDDLLDMIEHDGQAQALLFALILPILAANFSIEEGPEDKGEAEFARDVFLRGQHQGGMETPIHEVLAQMAEAQATKRMYFELVWQLRDDDHQVIQKIAWRPPRTCNVVVDEKGYLEGFYQRGVDRDGKGVDEKFVGDKAFVYIHQKRRRPSEGVSSFQTAYYDWLEKQKVNRLHNLHLQNFALGTVIARYMGKKQGGRTRLYNKVKEWLRGAGGAIVLDQSEGTEGGAGEDVNFIQASGAGTEFLDKISFLNSQIAGSVLLRFLMLGTESNTGAWALSRDHSDFFLMGQEAVQNDMASQFTNGPMAALIKRNFGEDASYPQAVFAPLAETSQKNALEVWSKLVVAANRPQGPEWDAIQDIAIRFLGVDMDKLEEDKEEAEGEEGEELPGGGKAEDLLNAIEKLVNTPSAQNGQGNGKAPQETQQALSGNSRSARSPRGGSGGPRGAPGAKMNDYSEEEQAKIANVVGRK